MTPIRCVLPLLLVLVPGLPHPAMAATGPDPAFVTVRTGDLVETIRDLNTPAWGDYDGDGDLDLFIAAFGGNNLLFRNDGNGAFVRQTSATAGPIVASAQIDFGIWTDFDNDGDLDLFRASASGPDRLLRNRGDGSFENFAVAAFTNDISSSFAAAWGDYDRDGFPDLAVTRGNVEGSTFTPSQVLVRNERGTTFTRVTASTAGSIVDDRGGGTACAWADVDNDGDPDLFVGNNATAARADHLFLNDGSGRLSRLANHPVTSDNSLAFSSAWGDFDNDGNLDLFVGNRGGQANLLYRGLGNGAFARITQGPVVEDRDPNFTAASAWADYDNDGFLDLYLGNAGRNFLFHNNGDGTFTRITTGDPATDPGTSIGVAWGDYNDDGFPDLVVANGGGDGPQFTRLYRNAGNTNHWLKLRLTGTASNRSALGTRVRVKATLRGREIWQLREIAGGHESGQDDPRPNFGLADATVADVVRIEWPSGIVQEIHNVPADQVLNLAEPVRLNPAVAVNAGQVELRAASWPGQVFDVEASPDLQSWSRVATVSGTNGVLRFPDPGAGAAPRFWRVSQPDGRSSGAHRP